MGDKRRFDIFASFIADLVPERKRAAMRVADVAAGKGYLTWALRERGFRCVTPFEPFPRKGGQVRRLNIQVRNFEGGDFDATDIILDEGAGCCSSVLREARAVDLLGQAMVRPEFPTRMDRAPQAGVWPARPQAR